LDIDHDSMGLISLILNSVVSNANNVVDLLVVCEIIPYVFKPLVTRFEDR
jgi:hypothetical protein